VKAALWGVFGNKGEMCTAASRLLLHEDIHDQFLDELVLRARKFAPREPAGTRDPDGPADLRPADGSHPGLHRTRETGGRAAADRGERDTDGEKANGYFIKPTIFSEVAPHMRIAQEEIFGPVLCAMRFRDAVDAIRIANGTIYGLASAVWTRDIKLAHRIAGELKAGSVWINTYNAFRFGLAVWRIQAERVRTRSWAYALEQYTSVKSVWWRCKSRRA